MSSTRRKAVKKIKSFDELYKELCDLPDNVVGEIINEELVVMPRPAPKHARASSSLGSKIFDSYDEGNGGPGGWWIFFEPEMHFLDDVIVPDIAGWKKERMPKLPEEAYFSLSPDWVCEVLSPSTARYDKISKFKIYEENKIPYYWIVDPLNRVLEIFELDQKNYKLVFVFDQNSLVKAPPFEELEFNLGSLWAD